VVDTEQDYGLESIILHHSFTQVKGRTIRIDCRERTHVGGVNGAGKTSILSLIPAFYGEEPERIVSKGSGRLSFVDYICQACRAWSFLSTVATAVPVVLSCFDITQESCATVL